MAYSLQWYQLPLQPHNPTSLESNKIVFKSRKRSQIHDSKPGVSDYTSKYFHQAINIMQEKGEKKEKALEKKKTTRQGEEKG